VAPTADEDMIGQLERISIGVAAGWFDTDPTIERVVIQDGPDGVTLKPLFQQQSPPRGRGRPIKWKPVWVAEQVGRVLLLGVRSRRARLGQLPRSRDGYFAESVAVVMDASGMPVPEDMFPLIAQVASYVEWFAFHSDYGRPTRV
jgi:hypothetical protein